jgi:hypothetical protein
LEKSEAGAPLVKFAKSNIVQPKKFMKSVTPVSIEPHELDDPIREILSVWSADVDIQAQQSSIFPTMRRFFRRHHFADFPRWTNISDLFDPVL